jgi:hypothetical protein
VFRTWAPVKFTNWVGMTGDVGRDLHWHFVVTEYAHTRLCRLRDAVAAGAPADAAPVATVGG